MRNNMASVWLGWRRHPPSRLRECSGGRGTQPAVRNSAVPSAARWELVNTTCATKEALPATPDASTVTLDEHRVALKIGPSSLRSTRVNGDSRSLRRGQGCYRRGQKYSPMPASAEEIKILCSTVLYVRV